VRNSLKSDDAPSVIAWLLWEMMFGDEAGPPKVPAGKTAPPPPPKASKPGKP
jgi:hypothetical protein